MTTEKHPGEGSGDKAYFTNRFGISETEVQMALAEIHYGSAQELEDYLALKYRTTGKK